MLKKPKKQPSTAFEMKQSLVEAWNEMSEDTQHMVHYGFGKMSELHQKCIDDTEEGEGRDCVQFLLLANSYAMMSILEGVERSKK